MKLNLDQDGHLVDHQTWSPDIAQQMAGDLELTEWHLQILVGVRQFYYQFGQSPTTRPLIKYLIKTVNPEINNAVLQQEFNTGLVARYLSKLAGLPKPANCL